MLRLDGSQGEGGGQILRSALALSLVTGRPVQISSIRARRPKPGLLRQHLTAVEAAARIGNASVGGAQIGSPELVFRPGSPVPGRYHFAVGTAGSATLVLQTILPALMLAADPSHLTIEGGTHNPFAPPFDFLACTFLPLLARMGPQVEARLERHGFYPAGGGRIAVDIRPASQLQRLDLLERGDLREVEGRALVANLPESIGTRELGVLRGALARPPERSSVRKLSDSPGLGNVLLLIVIAEHVTEVITGFGQKGVAAEKVAAGVAAATRTYLEAEVPVGPHLADQLLLPMALAGGGSFRTVAPSEHTRTNAAVIARFLPVDVRFEQESDRAWRVVVVTR